MVLILEKAGLFTSLQGLGQFGLQRYGINPRGSMDQTAVRLLNTLVGNPDAHAALEMHFPGPEIRFDADCLFAVGGADFAPELNSGSIENWRVYEAARSDVLKFRKPVSGTRCYLSVAGGLAFSEKYPTPFETRRLRAGESLGTIVEVSRIAVPGRRLAASVRPAYTASPRVRIIPGPEFDDLTEGSASILRSTSFTVSTDSNRMGYRLNGPPLALVRPIELLSAAVTFGTVQLLPDGQLIVLMADHQTSGGYPRLGSVIAADLSLVAQVGPGQELSFEVTTVRDAESAASRIENDITRLRTMVNFGQYWKV